jgi:hypothetical protein
MSRQPRDRQAERAALEAAAGRLLAGTPLRTTAGNLSATELIAESGLARWKVYEHRDLVEGFQARVKTVGAVPATMQALAADSQRLTRQLAEMTAALKAEQARTALLRRALAETTIELEHARHNPADNVTAFRLPAARRERRRTGRPPS